MLNGKRFDLFMASLQSHVGSLIAWHRVVAQLTSSIRGFSGPSSLPLFPNMTTWQLQKFTLSARSRLQFAPPFYSSPPPVPGRAARRPSPLLPRPAVPTLPVCERDRLLAGVVPCCRGLEVFSLFRREIE